MSDSEVHWTALAVFVGLFLFVTALGFFAARWKPGDLNLLDEWGLGGRRFGIIITWFLVGGDLYTAYTIIAVPALFIVSGHTGFSPFRMPSSPILLYSASCQGSGLLADAPGILPPQISCMSVMDTWDLHWQWR